MIVLDTHVLLWMDRDDKALGRSSRRLIEQEWRTGSIMVSAISFWESAMLEGYGRIQLPVTAEIWRSELLHAGIQEAPVDGRIALIAVRLAGFHKDPADRFIVATAIRHDAMLLTADSKILEWNGGMARHDARL